MLDASEKRGRNDPCWCGSGQKYKRCHLGRENAPPVKFSEVISTFERIRNHKSCLHPDASDSTCEGKIVRAHTVQEALLRLIAREGKVYGFPMNLGADLRPEGIIQPQLIGVNRASTFPGFCQKHDQLLFSAIERAPVRASEEHAFLLTYRAMCYELAAKRGAERSEPLLRSLDRGRPLPAQQLWQHQQDELSKGWSTGLRELQRQKTDFDELFKCGDYSRARYYIVWFDSHPDIVCSGWTIPDRDFEGHEIQNLSDEKTPAHYLALSLIPSGDRGCAYFSWISGEDTARVRFIASLAGLSKEQIPHAVVRFVLRSFENQCWRPSWWEQLDQEVRARILQYFSMGLDYDVPIPSNYLEDDGMRAVKWTVTECDTNAPELM